MYLREPLLPFSLVFIVVAGRVVEERLGSKKYFMLLVLTYISNMIAAAILRPFLQTFLFLGQWPLLHFIAAGVCVHGGGGFAYSPLKLRGSHVRLSLCVMECCCSLSAWCDYAALEDTPLGLKVLRTLIGTVVPLSVSWGVCRAFRENLSEGATSTGSTVLAAVRGTDEDAQRRRTLAEAALAKRLDLVTRGALSNGESPKATKPGDNGH